MHEWTHRCVFLLILAVAVFCAAVGFIGVGVYVDSGRSILKDLLVSNDHIWKEASCDTLFSAIPEARNGGALAAEAGGLCAAVRASDLPPVALKGIVDARKRNAVPGDDKAKVTDPGQARAVVTESKADFVRELPTLLAFYRPYQKRLSYMWLFIPALIGAIGGRFYCKFYAPVLFEAIKERIRKMLFGKSRYQEAYESFVNPAKKKKP